jgi:hypothetical protein
MKSMHVVATFEQSIYLEMALTALEQKGIAKEDILAVPLGKRTEPRRMFDTIHRADGYSVFDAAAVLGTVFMLLGTVYGYVLRWGPIIWGLIGAIFGMLLGFLIKYAIVKKSRKGLDRGGSGITSEVVVIVQCEESKWETVEQILWENTALGISKL